MRNAFVKTLAVIVAVVSAVCLIVSGVFVFFNVGFGLYTRDPQELLRQNLDWYSQERAIAAAEKFAFETSDVPEEIWRNYFGWSYLNDGYWEDVDYIIVDENGNSAEQKGNADYVYEDMVDVSLYLGHAVQVGENGEYYPEYDPATANTTLPAEIAPVETTPAETTVPEAEPTVAPGTVEETLPPTDYVVIEEGWDSEFTTDNGDIYRVYRDDRPTDFNVVLFYTQEQIESISGYHDVETDLGKFFYEERFSSITVLAVSLVVLILMLVYLACAAGRKPGSEEVKPGGLNALPLDLYTVIDCLLGAGLVYAFVRVLDGLLYLDRLWDESFWVLTLAGVGCAAGLGLICVLYWMALCAQIKAGNGYWWKNTLVGRFGRSIWNFIIRCLRKVFGLVTGVGGKVGEKMPTITELLRDFNDKLPLMWQWLGASLLMFVLLAFFGSLCYNGLGMFFYVIIVCLCLAAILYGARAFGQLRDAAKRMSQGNLDVKINPDTLEGCFKDFAGDLNALSDACVHAAREQLKSERMKTELITNVSHDIKTPLTSIINYVDLLQKAQTEQERKDYLEVLDRQSQRLKKLIEDLMEMSKASTGNVAVELQPTDVVESVNQALGEYADRFNTLKLNVVFHKPEGQTIALCDGKLLWRVMSNVMSNIVKYAMPGTRVYFDLSVSEFKVQLAMKNISREELNITAEELMERFVRGDESRNTEGNGLGLNIAKSLMEVQGGTLDLVVDGDLFKVVLTLPRTVCADIACES